jgi:hypothetical protein
VIHVRKRVVTIRSDFPGTVANGLYWFTVKDQTGKTRRIPILLLR